MLANLLSLLYHIKIIIMFIFYMRYR